MPSKNKQNVHLRYNKRRNIFYFCLKFYFDAGYKKRYQHTAMGGR
jgi:hypothetical protein